MSFIQFIERIQYFENLLEENRCGHTLMLILEVGLHFSRSLDDLEIVQDEIKSHCYISGGWPCWDPVNPLNEEEGFLTCLSCCKIVKAFWNSDWELSDVS